MFMLCVEDTDDAQKVKKIKLPSAPAYVNNPVITVASIHTSHDTPLPDVELQSEQPSASFEQNPHPVDASCERQAVSVSQGTPVKVASASVRPTTPALESSADNAASAVNVTSVSITTPALESADNAAPAFCTPRMPGSLSEKLDCVMKAIERLEAMQNRVGA